LDLVACKGCTVSAIRIEVILPSAFMQPEPKKERAE
jgi:hypothetical protein